MHARSLLLLGYQLQGARPYAWIQLWMDKVMPQCMTGTLGSSAAVRALEDAALFYIRERKQRDLCWRVYGRNS